MSDSDEELRGVLMRLARLIRYNRAEGEIGDTQLTVLFHLDIRGPLAPSDLAALEHVTPPSMNRALNGLEERGYITRSRSEEDARKVVVELTDAARDLLDETRRVRTAWFARRLSDLTPEERASLDAVLPVLRKLATE